MVDVVDILSVFALGLLSGVLIQRLSFRYSLKEEKIRRLTPSLEAVYPILDNLTSDSAYAKSLQTRGDDSEFRRVLKALSYSLEEYGEWFRFFQQSGMSPALESIDSDLLARFNGVFTHSRLYKLHGFTYLSQNLEDFAEYCHNCRDQLRIRLST